MQKYFIVYNHDEASERISRVPLSIDPFKYARKRLSRERERGCKRLLLLFIYYSHPTNVCSALQCYYISFRSLFLFRFVISFSFFSFFLSFVPLQCSTTRLVGYMLSQVHLYHCVSRFVTLWYHGHQPNQTDGEN